MKKSLLLILVVGFFCVGANAQIFEKDFEDMNLTSGGWTAVSVIGDLEWEVPETTYGHNDSYCSKMTGYDSDAEEAFENEDWFISPSFDAGAYSTITLNFWNTSGYDGNTLEAFYSEDYAGNPSTATWVPLTGIVWHNVETQDYWEWTESGNINIPATGSSAYIGFKFTNDDGSSPTWELDDIVLTGATNVNGIENSIRLFPNPASDVINLTNINTYDNVTVSNITGQTIYESAVSSDMQIDVSQYQAGIYVIKLSGENGTYIQKFVKE